MDETQNSIAPAEGERRAMRGYYPQYHLATSLIIKGLLDKSLVKVVLVNPDAGRVDDILIYSTHRLDAYQVKWSIADKYWNYNTDFIKDESGTPSILNQLVDGWMQIILSSSMIVMELYLFECFSLLIRSTFADQYLIKKSDSCVRASK